MVDNRQLDNRTIQLIVCWKYSAGQERSASVGRETLMLNFRFNIEFCNYNWFDFSIYISLPTLAQFILIFHFIYFNSSENREHAQPDGYVCLLCIFQLLNSYVYIPLSMFSFSNSPHSLLDSITLLIAYLIGHSSFTLPEIFPLLHSHCSLTNSFV